MKKIFKILFIIISFNINLKGDEDLLSGYTKLISSSSLNIPSQISKKVESSKEYHIKDKYEYLFFVFINGVNDLGILNFSIEDINEMEEVGSTDKVAVVVEHNRITRGDYGMGINFSNGANTYFILKDQSLSKDIVSKIIDFTPDGDMGSWKHFARSVKKAIRMFNPDKLIIVLWNHGNGYFGIAYDDVSGNYMKVDEIGKALKEISSFYGKKIDIFAMDACLMQMAEVLSEIKNYAKYVVASEETIPGAGYPYDEVLKNINRTSDVKRAAISIVEAYHNAYNGGKYSQSEATTLSVIDTSKFNGFISRLNRWVNTVTDSNDFKLITSTYIIDGAFFFEKREAMGSVLNEETEKILTRNADLVSYLKKVVEVAKDNAVKNETQTLVDYITSSLVVYHKGGDYKNGDGLSYKDDTYGLAIYLPKLRYRANTYENLNFAKISMWDEFIRKYISDKMGNDDVIRNYSNSFKGEAKSDYIFDSKDIEETSQNREQSNTSQKVLKNVSDNKRNDDEGLIFKNTKMKELSNENGVYQISKNIVAKPSITSMRYTNEKTLKPQLNELINLSSSNKNLSYNFNTTTITASPIDRVDKDKSKNEVSVFKDKMVDLKNQIFDKLNNVVETVFPDKEKVSNYREKLKEFDIEISTNLSIVHAKKLIDDKKLQKEFLKIDKNRTEKLISYAEELIEIKRILSINYSNDEINLLSKTLETHLDKSRLICEINLCIPPEKIIEWMNKNGNFTNLNIINAEYAIRKWERIFGETDFSNVRWAQARSIVFSSANWSSMSIRERNVILERIAKRDLLSGATSTIAIQSSDMVSLKAAKYQDLRRAIDEVSKKMLEKNVLNIDELNAIKSKPINEQMYILSQLFDRGGLKEDSEIIAHIKRINASRTSYPSEVIDENTRKFLGSYFSSNIKKEIDKSNTGRKLYENVYGKGRASISFEYISSESKSQGSNIVIDAEIVSQFLRVKGYTKDDLVKRDDVKKELMIYLSPLVVREMGNIEVSKLKKTGYFPNVREQYSIGLLYQAKYTKEREDIGPIFSLFGDISDYAQKVMIIKRNYEKSDNDRDFIDMVGIRYYSNLPTASQAKSEIILAINKELERRSKLDKKEKERIDKYAIFDSSNINTLSPYEITNYIKDIKTETLLKLKNDLSNERDFRARLYKLIDG